MYVRIWQFIVKPGSEDRFEALYGQAGGWVDLFRGSPGYVGTELLRDAEDPGRYLSIDRWESEAAYRTFEGERGASWFALDAAGEELTLEETLLGGFVLWAH